MTIFDTLTTMNIMPPIHFNYDIDGDNPLADVMEVARIAEVIPWSIFRVGKAPNGCAEINVGFYTNEDAIAFTAVYLGEEEDSVYVAEYLGFDWKELLPA